MMDLLERIYPLDRALVHNDMEKAIDLIINDFPDENYVIHEYPVGSKVWTWKIPERVKVNHAILKDEDGVIYADYNKHPLYLWSYSVSISKELSWKELEKHIYTNKKCPDAIPWYFKYYDKTWGFSIEHNKFSNMPREKKYYIDISTEFSNSPGLKNLTYYIDYGQNKDFLMTSNICHPFQVNDSITGVVAAVIIEAVRNKEPENEFIDTIRKKTEEFGIVLIVDEVSSAWRLNVGGAHLIYNIRPDIAVFAKGMSNGFPMAAIIGNKNIMDAAQTSFISSTYWTDKIGPTAAIATIKKMQKFSVPLHLIETGKRVKNGWKEIADKHSLKINVGGIDPLPHFSFENEESLLLKTLFTQLMLERGFLATTAFYASYAHKEMHITKYLKAVEECFAIIAKTIQKGNSKQFLNGPVCHSGFERLT